MTGRGYASSCKAGSQGLRRSVGKRGQDGKCLWGFMMFHAAGVPKATRVLAVVILFRLLAFAIPVLCMKPASCKVPVPPTEYETILKRLAKGSWLQKAEALQRKRLKCESDTQDFDECSLSFRLAICNGRARA